MESFNEKELKEIYDQYEELIKSCHRCKTEKERALIDKAFKIAFEAHKNTRRKSGEPYILHPISVARISTEEIGLGVTSVICSLLHDVVEDTEVELSEIEKIFGHKVAQIIDGLTKISGVFDNKSNLQAENFKKLLLTLSDDIRVILIKLADRLHNMRTLEALEPHKQYKVSGETLYLYAPLAHRLGLNAIKTELEDLAFKYQHPKIYEDIVKKVKESEVKNTGLIEEFKAPIEKALKNNHIDYTITSRTKSYYSIWNKIQQKGVTFDEIYDLLAIRIVFKPKTGINEKTQCWNIYSLLTDFYYPKPERIRDWISKPKANGYEALHVTLMGPSGKWFEVQIRSERMDEIAERGYAAHYKYKGQRAMETELDKWLARLKETLNDQSSDALKFLDDFKLNLFSQEIYVFTPKGKVITLPKGSTALDFAYEIHSKIGNKAIGAKINHKLVPLNQVLSSGDQIEIITADHQTPQLTWLKYVITAKAKSTITDTLKAEHKDRIIKGQKILENKLKELSLPPTHRIFKKLIEGYKLSSKDELYSKIGSGIITLEDFDNILKRKSEKRWIKSWDIIFNQINTESKKNKLKKTTKKLSPLDINSEKNLNYRFAPCCNPIPGDDIVGFKEPDGKITIHKTSCKEALRLMSNHGETIITATWEPYKLELFLAKLRLYGIDRQKMYFDIAKVISDEGNISIRSINLDSSNGVFEGTIDLYVHNTKDLEQLRSKLNEIEGIESVFRVEQNENKSHS
jgi:GTP pyrophosphokinase